jgi:hypothetical protein
MLYYKQLIVGVFDFQEHPQFSDCRTRRYRVPVHPLNELDHRQAPATYSAVAGKGCVSL